MDQPGKVANPARGQLNMENNIPLSPWCVPENVVSRDGFSRPVPRQLAHLHTQAEYHVLVKFLSLQPMFQRKPFDCPEGLNAFIFFSKQFPSKTQFVSSFVSFFLSFGDTAFYDHCIIAAAVVCTV